LRREIFAAVRNKKAGRLILYDKQSGEAIAAQARSPVCGVN
jgi:hypothetical protein